MNSELSQSDLPQHILTLLQKQTITHLRPSQKKSLDAGLLKENNLLVCTPTASGKTLIAEIAMIHTHHTQNKKSVYIVPLKALASEKFHSFKEKYPELKIALSIGDMDEVDAYLHNYDIIITTSEKLDSLIRHHTPWIHEIGCVVVDEIHLINDPGRGPTLEILITILRSLINAQFICLSATIGNPKELAGWLDANYVEDNWRPVELKEGIVCDNNLTFYSKSQ